jgi:hypothetical protein
LVLECEFMKTMIIYVFTLFFGFIMQENINEKKQSVKFSIELPDTIYQGQQNVAILLKVENITSEVITINNPAHWGNAYPSIKQGQRDIPLIKIKINPQHLNDTIQIKGKEILEVNFDYALDKMMNFNSLPSGKYEIQFQLQGKILIKSNILKFYKE